MSTTYDEILGVKKEPKVSVTNNGAGASVTTVNDDKPTTTNTTTPTTGTSATTSNTLTEKDVALGEKKGLETLGRKRNLFSSAIEYAKNVEVPKVTNSQETPTPSTTPMVEDVDAQKEALKTGDQVGVGEFVNDAIAENEKLNGLERIIRRIEREDAERKRQYAEDEKRHKRAAMFTAIGDGINALSNLYFTTKGAPNQFDPKETMSGKMRERWDRIEADRRREALASRTEQMRLLSQAAADARYWAGINARNVKEENRHAEATTKNDIDKMNAETKQQEANTKQAVAENQNKNRDKETESKVAKNNAQANKLNSGASGGSKKSGGKKKSSSSGRTGRQTTTTGRTSKTGNQSSGGRFSNLSIHKK